jgi:general secretion pathway protein C
VLRRAGLRQGLTVLHYALIALSAWAAAVVVLKIASLDLSPEVQTRSSADNQNLVAARSRRAADDTLILKRNLFGATDLDVDAVEAPAAGESDLKLRGVASSEGTDFAVFENVASGEQNVFAVGEKIFDGPRLVAVDPEGADVLVRGKKRRYEIEEDGTADAGRKPRENAKKAGGRNVESGVRKTGEGAYLVDRREVEHAVANLNEVITQARAVPVLQEGKSAGFKLFSIRPNSIFQKIGLVDGDIVQRVNDTELTDPSKAVGLLEEIQSMNQVRVGFMRSGKQQTFTYTIR